MLSYKKRMRVQLQNRSIVLRGWVIATILAIVSMVLYMPSLAYGFVFDDYPTIVHYIHLKHSTIWSYLGNVRWLSRMLHHGIVQWWGVFPFPFRVAAFSLHLLSGIILFWIMFLVLLRLRKFPFFSTNALLIAVLTAGLFLWHPVQTQTVLYVTQATMEGLVVLCSFVIMLTVTLMSIIRGRRKKMALGFLSLLVALVASGTKEIIIVLPALVFIFDWFFLAQGVWQEAKKRLFVHLGITFVVVGMSIYSGVMQPSLASAKKLIAPVANNRGNVLTRHYKDNITSQHYCLSQSNAIVHYLRIFFYPVGLSFDYDTRLAAAIQEVLVPLGLLFCLLLGMCLLFVAQPTHPIIFCFVWFFVALLPRASIFPSTELICDYRTYYPSLGVLFFISIVVTFCILKLIKVIQLYQITFAPFFVAAAFLLLCSYATAIRSCIWSSELTLWEDVIHHAPGKSRAYNNYAVALLERGRKEEAKNNFNMAIALDGYYAEPHINLGAIYQKEKLRTLAKMHYRKALEIGEGHPELFYNLAMLYLDEGKKNLASCCLCKALELRPHYVKALFLISNVYYLQQKFGLAAQAYEKAIKFKNLS